MSGRWVAALIDFATNPRRAVPGNTKAGVITMHGKTLKEWKAKRAGGRITVYGTDVRTGEPAKLVGVDEITPRSTTEPKRRFLGGNTGERHIVEAYAVAVDMHGTEHRLLIA
jgi:hypothetical protein